RCKVPGDGTVAGAFTYRTCQSAGLQSRLKRVRRELSLRFRRGLSALLGSRGLALMRFGDGNRYPKLDAARVLPAPPCFAPTPAGMSQDVLEDRSAPSSRHVAWGRSNAASRAYNPDPENHRGHVGREDYRSCGGAVKRETREQY